MSLRAVLLIVGLLALAIGAIWIGQATGYFPYPASSVMINQTEWAYYGAGLAIVGAVLVGLSRRR